MVFISHCYRESHRGELFLKHSVFLGLWGGSGSYSAMVLLCPGLAFQLPLQTHCVIVRFARSKSTLDNVYVWGLKFRLIPPNLRSGVRIRIAIGAAIANVRRFCAKYSLK